MTRVTVGRTNGREERIAVEIVNGPALTRAQAVWLRDRLDEELALLDGGAVTDPGVGGGPDPERTSDADRDDHADVHEPPDESPRGAADRRREREREDLAKVEDATSDEAADGAGAIRETEEQAANPRIDEGVELQEPEPDRTTDLDGLLDIKGIGGSKVDALREDGFETIHDVRCADVSEIAQHGTISMAVASTISEHVADESTDEDEGESDGESENDKDGDQEQPSGPNEGDGSAPDLDHECPIEDCGKRFDDVDDMRVHRDDAHDEIAVKRAYREQVRRGLPSDCSIADVERAVVSKTKLYDVSKQLPLSPSEVKPVVEELQLLGVLNEHGEAQARHRLEDLYDELGLGAPEWARGETDAEGEGKGGASA